ncbi:MAG: type 1 glutamine amidotransferase domain-containing protein [Polyangiaceae bacterium]|jgi:protease I
MKKLSGKRVAILVADGFEAVELTGPRTALEDEGAETEIISPVRQWVKSWRFTDWGRKLKVNVPIDRADPHRYDALLLPGGVMNPDKLRLSHPAIQFIRSFAASGKPIAAICHGPWTLIDAGFVQGKTMTSWPSLQTDLRNAGAHWVDQEVAVDSRLVTSRKPDDIPAFNQSMIALFAEHASLRERLEQRAT